MGKEFLTYHDIATRYGVQPSTVGNWLRKGKIPQGIKIDRTRRWAASEIEAWERENMRGGVNA